MAVLFAAVTRDRTVLAQHASSAGNFSAVTEKALSKIMEERQQQRLTFSHESFLIHYICQDKIIYLCVTDAMKKCFQMTYGSRAQMVLPRDVDGDFSGTIATLMKNYSNHLSLDRVLELQMQMEELKEIMVHNIDLVAQRGEKLDVLIHKTDNLAFSTITFKTKSHNLARSLWMRNVKLTVVAVLVIITVAYLSATAACGGPSWPSCVA